MHLETLPEHNRYELLLCYEHWEKLTLEDIAKYIKSEAHNLKNCSA